MNKEEVLFQKRIQDLAKAAYLRSFPMFTDFLSMNEISILHDMIPELKEVHVETYGGYALAERQMARIAPDALFEFDKDSNTSETLYRDYPIVLLKIEPANLKFAEALTHRDYLGSLIGLGMERSKIGDIVLDDSGAYVFCQEKISSFFLQELTKVRHTFVKVNVCEEQVSITPQFREQKGTVASLRADAIVSMAYNLSRSSCIALFQSQKVFVNGKLTESNSHHLKEGDIVSVRGHGKFIFRSLLSVTKKERFFIAIDKYGER